MEMNKKQITLPDGRTLIYFSFPKNKGGDSEIATQNVSKDGKASAAPKCCCGGDK